MGSKRDFSMKSSISLAACGTLLLATALHSGAVSAQSPVKTGKERLGDKGSDEQRVDNCKVPPERWGTTARPAACAQGAKAAVTH
ncbi:MAG: hypothetical protein JOZ16_14160 [Methylobacteriaceae bacterium]|nr:hypothetical protein [Methylobacteriaceae bacterium]